MATSVKFTLPTLEIENTGISFKRDLDTGLHGELTIRQNHIEWRPKGNEFIHRVTWDQLADFAVNHGRRLRPKVKAVQAKKKLKGSGA